MTHFSMKTAVLALATTFGLLAAPGAASAANVYTSPQPYHLEYEYDYRGLKTKFVSDLWLVVDQNGDGSYTVKLTGWAYIRQRNAGKKLWEDKSWTPFRETARVRNGVLSDVQEVGIAGAKVRTSTTVSFARQKATHEITLVVGKHSHRILSATADVRLPRS